MNHFETLVKLSILSVYFLLLSIECKSQIVKENEYDIDTLKKMSKKELIQVKDSLYIYFNSSVVSRKGNLKSLVEDFNNRNQSYGSICYGFKWKDNIEAYRKEYHHRETMIDSLILKTLFYKSKSKQCYHQLTKKPITSISEINPSEFKSQILEGINDEIGNEKDIKTEFETPCDKVKHFLADKRTFDYDIDQIRSYQLTPNLTSKSDLIKEITSIQEDGNITTKQLELIEERLNRFFEDSEKTNTTISTLLNKLDEKFVQMTNQFDTKTDSLTERSNLNEGKLISCLEEISNSYPDTLSRVIEAENPNVEIEHSSERIDIRLLGSSPKGYILNGVLFNGVVYKYSKELRDTVSIGKVINGVKEGTWINVSNQYVHGYGDYSILFTPYHNGKKDGIERKLHIKEKNVNRNEISLRPSMIYNKMKPFKSLYSIGYGLFQLRDLIECTSVEYQKYSSDLKNGYSFFSGDLWSNSNFKRYFFENDSPDRIWIEVQSPSEQVYYDPRLWFLTPSRHTSYKYIIQTIMKDKNKYITETYSNGVLDTRRTEISNSNGKNTVKIEHYNSNGNLEYTE